MTDDAEDRVEKARVLRAIAGVLVLQPLGAYEDIERTAAREEEEVAVVSMVATAVQFVRMQTTRANGCKIAIRLRGISTRYLRAAESTFILRHEQIQGNFCFPKIPGLVSAVRPLG